MPSRPSLPALLCLGAALCALPGCAPDPPGAERGKTVLVCLDGGTWDALTPLLEAGELPEILELMRGGTYGPLRSDPPFSPPSWTSLATGLEPEHHGITNFVRRREVDPESGAYELVPIRAGDVRAPRFWQMVASYGRAVNVQRWLFTYPIEELPGVVVSDFQGKAADFLRHEPLERILRNRFQPRLFVDSAARLGHDPTRAHDPADSPERFRERDAQLQAAVRDIDFAEQAFEHVLEGYPEIELHSVSFFWGNQMQHEFLHYWQAPRRFGTDPADAERYREVVPDLYRVFDEFLGRLRADPRIERIVICSDHGMELIPRELETSIGAYHFQILWDRILADLGFDEVARPVAYRRTETGLAIDPGAAPREEVQDRLASALESIRFTDNGGALFAEVHSPDQPWPDLVVGRYAPVRYGELPRLFERRVSLPGGDREQPLSRYLRFAGGFIRAEHGYDLNPDVPLGADGILLAHGPGVTPGRRLEIGAARTVDLAPTLLYLMGLPIGADMDGRVLEELVRPELLDARPIESIPSYRGRVAERAFVDEGEGEGDAEYDRRTMERLRSLGYVN